MLVSLRGRRTQAALGVDPGFAGDQRPPGSPQELLALARTHRSFFLLHPIRLSIRLTVDSLTLTPATFRRYSRLWGSVAPGRSSMSDSRSFLALSSIFGWEPGRFFGVSERPSSTILAYRSTEERL